MLITYRKRNCGKVMFLHLSVILFTGEWSLSRMVSVHQVSVQGVSFWGLCPGGSLCPGVSAQGGLCPGGSLSWGVSVLGVSVQGVSVQRESLSRGVSVLGVICLGAFRSGNAVRMVKNRRYTSYLNAFL